MERHKQKKLKMAMRRMFSLLLAALTLSGSAFADNTDANTLRALYGDDWEKVAALQPGDSYVGEDFMYVCHDDSYVKWQRVKSRSDLNGASWKTDRLLLLTSTDGKELYIGNDYVNLLKDGSYKSGKYLNATKPNAVRTELDRDSGEQVERYAYPEMQEYAAKSTGGYPYPDSFQTGSTLNAPYIRYVGKDGENDNHPVFKIILSKDNGEISAVALGLDSGEDELELEAVRKSDGFTIRMTNFLDIFVSVDYESDVHLIRQAGGKLVSTETAPESGSLVAYVGEKFTTKRIEVYDLHPDAAQNPDALENVYGGKVEFYHWEKVRGQGELQYFQDGGRMLLVWDDKYFLSGDDFRMKDDEEGMALYVNEDNTSSAAPGKIAEYPEIDLTKNEFYTADGMGTPYVYKKYISDEAEYDYTYFMTCQLAGADDRPSGKWLCDADNVLGICTEEAGQAFDVHGGGDKEENRIGFIVGRWGYSGNDASPGKVKVFFEDTNGFDTALYHSGNVLYGEDDGKDWDYGEFTMYRGEKTTYPAVRQDYIVGEDQFMHISQNGAMLKDVTITVQKGGVLSVESWFMNNGRIVVDGGTLIVQEGENPMGDENEDDTEDSILMPYLDINPAVSGSLDLRNGGELIVLEDARAAFNRITATGGSSILNNGMLLAETISLRDSTLENRKGMSLFVGYDSRRMTRFRNGSVGQVVDNLASRLQTDIPCIHQGLNSSIHNDGIIRYSTIQSLVDDDSVKLSGIGEYVNLRGKAVK